MPNRRDLEEIAALTLALVACVALVIAITYSIASVMSPDVADNKGQPKGQTCAALAAEWGITEPDAIPMHRMGCDTDNKGIYVDAFGYCANLARAYAYEGHTPAVVTINVESNSMCEGAEDGTYYDPLN